jgi:hypothetical protein
MAFQANNRGRRGRQYYAVGGGASRERDRGGRRCAGGTSEPRGHWHRGDLEREQLFELDRTIQQLTQSGADPESLVRLTGHYHSLLRMWSEI